MLDWYYIYSQRYFQFHDYLQQKVNKNIYTLRGLFIDQSVFDEHLYKHEGEHFFSRITVKVDAIIDIIQTRITYSNPEPFFFSDCDIMIGNLADTLVKYKDISGVDIFFQQEVREADIVNPGFMLIWPNETTLQFWKRILEDIVTKNEMEMSSINVCIRENTINYRLFSYIDVCSTLTYSQPSYGICHLVASSQGRDEDMGEKLYQVALLSKHINGETL